MMPSSPKLSKRARRPSRFTLIAIVLGILGFGALAVFGRARYHLWAAEKALKHYDFQDAQAHLDLYLKVRPSDADARLLAAQTARRLDDYERAERELAKAVEQKGNREAIALERSLLSAQQGNLEAVERSLRARTDPDYPEAVLVLEALAKGYANRYRHMQTLVCLNILLDRDPIHPHALLARAHVWEDRAAHGEKDREQDALQDYEKAVDLNPTFEARLGLAGTLYRVGRVQDALDQYERLLQMQPGHAEAIFGLARCRYSLHNVQESKQLLQELLEQQPDHAGALLELGRVMIHEGRWAEAETWLRQAVAHSPRFHSEPVRVLCRCLEAANKTEEARKCSVDLAQREAEVIEVERMTLQAKREPFNSSLRFDIGRKLMALGREQDGVAALMTLVDLDPRNAQAHEALAEYFERAGQTDRALRHRRAQSSSSVKP